MAGRGGRVVLLESVVPARWSPETGEPKLSSWAPALPALPSLTRWGRLDLLFLLYFPLFLNFLIGVVDSHSDLCMWVADDGSRKEKTWSLPSVPRLLRFLRLWSFSFTRLLVCSFPVLEFISLGEMVNGIHGCKFEESKCSKNINPQLAFRLGTYMVGICSTASKHALIG